MYNKLSGDHIHTYELHMVAP